MDCTNSGEARQKPCGCAKTAHLPDFQSKGTPTMEGASNAAVPVRGSIICYRFCKGGVGKIKPVSSNLAGLLAAQGKRSSAGC